MLKGIFDVLHYLGIIAYMRVVVQANQGIGLVVYGFDRLFRTYHEREHLGVAVSVVRLEIAPAYLPGAEKFRSVIA